MVQPFVSVYRLPAPHSFKQSQCSSPMESEQRRGNIGMQNTVSPYIATAGRLRCACTYTAVSSPIAAHISHVPDCGSLGWQVVSALQGPALTAHSHWPQRLALQRASSMAKGSRGLLNGECIYTCSTLRRWIEIYLCVINRELQLTGHFLYECNLLCHYQFMFI